MRHHVDRYVFIDETSANTQMSRLYGWGLKSERVVDLVPHGHWKTTTFIGAVRSTGLTAPLVIDGPVNGELFAAYVRQQLVPTLTPGDIVVLDNLSSHKSPSAREAIEAAGGTVAYLPPYSPDLNPIELLFSKLKTLLRKHAERTVEALWSRIGQLIPKSTSTECLNYFRHCGYTCKPTS